MFAQSSRRPLILLSLLAVLVLTASGTPISAQPSSSDAAARAATSVSDATFRSSPIMFIENSGQWDDRARFQVWGGPTGTMWLAEDAIWLTVVERPADDIGRSQVDPLARFDPQRANVERDDVPRKVVNIKLSFVGANPHPRIEPFYRLDTVVSYFIGNEPEKWRPDVPVWGGVRYVDLYAGVDLEVTREGGQMVQRLFARPGVDLSAVRLRVEGADAVRVDGDALRLLTAAGEFAWPLLRADGWQASGSMVAASGTRAFHVLAPYAQSRVYLQAEVDHPQSLGDNPSELFYGTYLGGAWGQEFGHGIAADGAGGTYVTGWTDASDFPTTPGGFDRTFDSGPYDAFIVKLNSTGSGLVYATLLGGNGNLDDKGNAIVVDGAGNAMLTGTTSSGDFPTTPGAYDRSWNGGDGDPGGGYDAFVVKLNSTGSALIYSTYLGGNGNDEAMDIAIDSSGSAYLTGLTSSEDYPTTPGAYDRTHWGMFVSKLNPTGSILVYSTFLDGGFSIGIAVDDSGNAYLTGVTASSAFPTTPGAFDPSYNGGDVSGGDAFVVKLNAAGSGLAYSTFLGGSGDDMGVDVAVDRAGSAYVTGETGSRDFPTTSGAFDPSFNGGSGEFDAVDAFSVKLNTAGSGLAYATFLGGMSYDSGSSIFVDEMGCAYVAGATASTDFPTTPGAFDRSYNGDRYLGGSYTGGDIFVVKLNPSGNELINATFLGGGGEEGSPAIAVDTLGRTHVTGYTMSTNFPTTQGAFDPDFNGGYYGGYNFEGDAFVAKLAMTGAPTYTISGRVTNASGTTGILGVTVWAGFPRNTMTDANGNYTFTGLPAGTYNLRAEKTGYAICPHSRQVTLPPDASGQNFTGLPATVSLGFCPASDDYSFSNSDSNWGTYPSPPAWGDFTMADTRRMCGDQAVCLSPWLPGWPCAYKLSAETWNFIVNLGMIKGHCAGMAATSLRFFKDIDQPSDFQAGVTTTFGLDLLGETRRNIAYYQAEQSALPILSYKLSQQRTSTPVQTLDALRVAMTGDASDPVVLVLKSGENQHAVTPIALEDRGNGIWAVWVYDNELPGSASAVMINTLNNTWSRGSWSGDASSHSLYVIAMSLFNGEQTCPFSLSPVTAATLLGETPNGQIWLTENANLLITDSLGRRLGYVGDQLVSEIPGAGRVDFIGGTSHPAIPLYSIPLTETYTMLLDGQPLTQTQTLRLAQFGPGYAASVENLVVSPTTRDEISIAIDGSQLQYRANVGKEATLTLAQDGTNESYQLSLRDIQLHASKTITLTNDISTERLVFANNPGASNSYDLAITRATAATGGKRFYHADLTADPGDVQSFDYRAWDGSGVLVMQIDHNGDGSIDETRVLQNQIRTVYLPIIRR